MANEMNTALKAAADKIASYIGNMATLTVETRFVDVGDGPADFAAAQPAACTVIRMDGDCSAVLPMRRNTAGVLEVDVVLFELHERNVTAAVDYRDKMMTALLSTIKSG